MKIQISGSTKGVFVANTTYSRDAFIIVFLDAWYERIVFVLLVSVVVVVYVVCDRLSDVFVVWVVVCGGVCVCVRDFV